MESVRIYLSGGMGNLSWEEQSKWRSQVINAIKYGDKDCNKKPVFFNPIEYYNFEEVRQRSEREIMEFDLNALQKTRCLVYAGGATIKLYFSILGWGGECVMMGQPSIRISSSVFWHTLSEMDY